MPTKKALTETDVRERAGIWGVWTTFLAQSNLLPQVFTATHRGTNRYDSTHLQKCTLKLREGWSHPWSRRCGNTRVEFSTLVVLVPNFLPHRA